MTLRERHAAADGTTSVARLLRRWEPGPWTRHASAISVVTALLVVIGLVMSFSASFVDGAQEGDTFGVFLRQLMWAGVGVAGFALAARLDHRIWRRLSWPMLALAVIGLLLVLVPGVGITRFGSTRWLGYPPLVVQPSEIAKLAVLLWLADVLHRKRPVDGSVHSLEHLMVPAVPVLVGLSVLVLAQPDLGTTILLAVIVGSILWVEGLPGRVVAGFAVAGVAAMGVLAAVAPYRVARIHGWLSPEADPLGTGYQLIQSRLALGSGGIFGVGLGSSRGKWNFIPNPETDFIFAILGEELGLLGAGVVLSLFATLLWVGLHVAYTCEEGFGRTAALAITAWLVGQALINVGTVTGLLPITGVTLPLVSVGGSSLVTSLVALGILTSIARRPADPRPARADAQRTGARR